MKSTLKFKLILAASFLIFAMLTEIYTFKMIGFGSLPTYYLVDISLLLCICALFFAIPGNRTCIVVASIFLITQSVVSYVNITMYDIYGDLFSWQFMGLTHEAFQAIGPNMLNIGKAVILVLNYLVFLLLNVGLVRKYFSKKEFTRKEYLKRLASVCLIFSICGTLGMQYQKKKFKDNQDNVEYFYTQDMIYQFSSLNIKSESFKNFGTYGYYLKELDNLFLKSKKVKKTTIKNISDSIANYHNNTNDFTGYLKNKNVITIMLESTQAYAINETLTPNLYKISQEGLNLTNNVSRNKTNVSEFIGMHGSYPMSRQLSENSEYTLPFSIVNILNDYGYLTNYVHENELSYYSRNKIMPQVGFDNVYGYEDYYDMKDYAWGEWESDSKFAARAINELVPETNSKFYTFWTTLTTHGPYAESEKMEKQLTEAGYFDKIDKLAAEGNWINYMEGTGYEEKYRFYQATVMDLDAGIGKILNRLEELNILDDTVIVIYGDHQVYYDQIYMYALGNGDENFSYSYLYRTPLFIYNKSLSNYYKKVTGSTDTQLKQFSSTYNIVPTLLDLLGVDYYETLYPATSIFYDEDDYDQKNVFVSLQGGIFNNDVFTANGNDLINSEVADPTIPLDNVRKAANYFFSKMDYIEKLYNYNLFKDELDYKSYKKIIRAN